MVWVLICFWWVDIRLAGFKWKRESSILNCSDCNENQSTNDLFYFSWVFANWLNELSIHFLTSHYFYEHERTENITLINNYICGTKISSNLKHGNFLFRARSHFTFHIWNCILLRLLVLPRDAVRYSLHAKKRNVIFINRLLGLRLPVLMIVERLCFLGIKKNEMFRCKWWCRKKWNVIQTSWKGWWH